MTRKTAASITTGMLTAILYGVLSATTQSQAVADWPWDAPCQKSNTCLGSTISPDGVFTVAGDPEDEEDDDWPWD
jgi:hypothetical protein